MATMIRMVWYLFPWRGKAERFRPVAAFARPDVDAFDFDWFLTGIVYHEPFYRNVERGKYRVETYGVGREPERIAAGFEIRRLLAAGNGETFEQQEQAQTDPKTGGMYRHSPARIGVMHWFHGESTV